MRPLKIKHTLTFGLVITPIFLVVVLFVGWRKGIASAEEAAWVQAIGTVGAIFSAVWIARGDERREARKAREATANALNTLSGVAEHAAQTIRATEKQYSSSRGRMFGRPASSGETSALADAISALQSLPLTNIPPDIGVVTSVMALRRTLLEAIDVVEAMRMDLDRGMALIILADTAETCAAGIKAGAKAFQETLA
jgi:hypothetical protein